LNPPDTCRYADTERLAEAGIDPSVGNVGERYDNALAETIARLDVRIGVAGVEVIDRHPVETGSQIALYLPNQVAGEGAEVRQYGAVLSGDDDAELTRVALRSIENGAAIGAIRVGRVERAAGTVAGDAVALQVAQMHGGAAASGAHRNVAGLDNDPACAGLCLRPAPWWGGSSAREGRAPAALGRQVSKMPCAGRRWPAGDPGQRTRPRDRTLHLHRCQHPSMVPAACEPEARAKARVIVGLSHAPRLAVNQPPAKEPWWHCENAPMEAALTRGYRASLRICGTVSAVDTPMCRQRNRDQSRVVVPQAFILPSLLIQTLPLRQSSFSKCRSTEIAAMGATRCDLPRRTAKVG